jgi:hypothetical protein
VTNAIPVHNPSSLATDLLLAQVSETLAAQQELFNKLPASTYHDATAVAGARVGALSMLLNSGSRTSPGDVGSGPHWGTITRAIHFQTVMTVH